KVCDGSCATCSGPSSSECLTCPGAYVLNANKQCVNPCPAGTYGTSGNCKNCDSTCATCEAAGSNACTSCTAPRTLNAATRQCISNCPDCADGEYLAGQCKHLNAPYCADCHPKCETCSGPLDTECKSCPEGTHLEHGQCVTECSYGKYSAGGTCTDCDDSCADCDGLGYRCTDCAAPKVLDVGQCRSEAPPTCVACHASCATCDGPAATDCLTCPESTNFDNGECVSSCDDGDYEDTTQQC
ncbi:uncharacterized protein MONBRDRAFT_2316, partial [Monosiga brevicollis MX1]